MTGQQVVVPGQVAQPEELLNIAYDAGRDYPSWRLLLTESGDESIWIQIFRAGGFGVWALSWNSMPPGTGYLDHEGVRGAVFVARGALTHERARLGCAPHPEEVGAGHGFCFDQTFYHRMYAVPDAGPTVTVHVFASADLDNPPNGAGGICASGLGLPRAVALPTSARTAQSPAGPPDRHVSG